MRAIKQMTVHAFAVLFCVVAVGACGGTMNTGGVPAWLPPADTTLPPLADLDAWLESTPTTAAERLSLSFGLETAGDVEAALAVLLEHVGPTGDAWLDTAIAQRVWAFRDISTTFGERVGTVAPDMVADVAVAPAARLLWQMANVLTLHREHRYGMNAGLFERGPLGSPTTWRVAGPLSSFPTLDIDVATDVEQTERLQAEVMRASGPVRTLRVATRGSGATLESPLSGIFIAESFFETAGTGEVLLRIATGSAFVASVDGVDVARRGPEQTYTGNDRWVRFAVNPGVHRLRIRLGAEQAGTRFAVQLLPLDDVAIVGFDADLGEGASVAGVGEVGPNWSLAERVGTLQGGGLQWLVASAVALDTGAGEPAAKLLEFVGPVTSAHPVIALHASRMAAVADTMEPARRVEFALQAAASSVDAWRPASGAWLDIASAYLREGQFDAAESALDAIAVSEADNYAVQLALAELYGNMGWSELRRAAIERAAALFPRHCPTVSRAMDDRIGRGISIAPADLPEEWLMCDATWRTIAERYHVPRGELTEALEIAARIDTREPGNHRADLAVDLAIALGDIPRADALLEEFERWSPYDARGARMSDVALAGGDRTAASSALDQLLETSPNSIADTMARAYVNSTAVLERYRRDGLEIVQAYQDEAPAYDGAVVYVYDYGMTRVFDNGDAIELVHQILEVRTRDALGELGEMGIPSGATLLTARTIKPDGRWYVPDDIAGKDSISMPNLERGDFIELEWMAPVYAGLDELPAFRSSRFYFASFDGPFHESIAQYVQSEAASSGPFALDVRGENVEVTETREDGLIVHTAQTHGSVPPVMEARAVHAAEWLPSSRAARGYTWEVARREYEEAFEALLVPTDSLTAGVAELLSDVRGARAQVRTLYRFISDDVPDFGGFFSTPASWTWESGEGERAPLFIAMLRAAGFEPQLVFVRPWDQDFSNSDIPDIGVYDLSAVRIPTREGDIWVEPDFERYPFGYLRPDGQRCRGLVIAGPDAGSWVTTPELPTSLETSEIDVTVAVQDGGAAQVQIRERVPLRVAHGFRLFAQSADDEREIARQLEASLANSFPGVSDLDVTFDGMEDTDAPIGVTYSFTSTGFTTARDGGLVFEGEIFSRPLANWYASRATRTTDMLLGTPLFERLTVRFEAPSGWRVSDVPTDANGAWEDVTWSRTFSRSPGQVTMRRNLELPVRRVAATAYPALAESLNALRAGDTVRIAFAPEE